MHPALTLRAAVAITPFVMFTPFVSGSFHHKTVRFPTKTLGRAATHHWDASLWAEACTRQTADVALDDCSAYQHGSAAPNLTGEGRSHSTILGERTHPAPTESPGCETAVIPQIYIDRIEFLWEHMEKKEIHLPGYVDGARLRSAHGAENGCLTDVPGVFLAALSLMRAGDLRRPSARQRARGAPAHGLRVHAHAGMCVLRLRKERSLCGAGRCCPGSDSVPRWRAVSALAAELGPAIGGGGLAEPLGSARKDDE